ncbi:hypothetical protein [Paraburkholderia sp. BR14320]|uniref:hypothetical protein n=1 Tax=unclassified Paraburkholderia TaxID=2615204 RepID=UPI0034CECB05
MFDALLVFFGLLTLLARLFGSIPLAALNERRRRAVKMRIEGVALKEVALRCEMSPTTVIAACKAYEAGRLACRGCRASRSSAGYRTQPERRSGAGRAENHPGPHT